MMGGYVTNSTTKKSLFWVIAITILATLYGCVHLQWMQAQDDAEQIHEAPALRD